MALLETLLEDFHTALEEAKKSIPRQLSFPKAEKLIKVAIGMRRTGKTYFLFQEIHTLLAQGIPLDAILYINFEDDRLLPMNQKGMADLIDSFFSLYPENHNRVCYLFLDELHNVDGWELVVRRLHDSKKIQIYLSGSSAKLLSKEIATSLRGRALSIEVWPYNFSEYRLAHGINNPEKPIGKKTLDITGKHFLDFLKQGGFPGVQELQESAHRETLQNYVETVIFRDIVERYRVSNIVLLKYLTSFLLKSFAATFSSNKFYNDIKSQGYQVAKDSIYNFLDYLEDSYLISTVSIFTESLRVSQITPKKIYAVDSGLIQANIFTQVNNWGRLLENQIYLDLRRENKKIFYYVTKSGYHIDFITQSQQGDNEIIQVVWDLQDEKTRLREERALEEAKKELNMPGKILDKNSYLKQLISLF